MRVLVIGATGYVGTAVRERLSTAFDVVSFVRRDDASAVHGEVRRGDLAKPWTLAAAVTDDIDAVVNVATPIDEEVDTAVVKALVTALKGTGKPLIYS